MVAVLLHEGGEHAGHYADVNVVVLAAGAAVALAVGLAIRLHEWRAGRGGKLARAPSRRGRGRNG